ncbi:tetrapyrrole methylase, partial [Baffinella frigidus]
MGANFPAAARTVRALVLVLVCADLSASVASPSPQTTFPSCTPRAAPLAFATSTSPAFLRGPAALLRRPANRITARCPLRPSLRLPFMCLAGASDDAEDEEIAEDGPPPAKFQVRKGTLYIVATPIGNLEDITVRALAVLHGVDVIASEDTRRTGRLLKHFGIATPQVSHHEHNWRAASVQLVKRMQTGESVAVVSDAGTPGIADPGTELVRACVAGGVRVEPVPGACAAVAAVSAAGLAGDGFAFRGFLPPKGAARREALLAACASTVPVVLYEAPHRTQMHEELVHGTVAEAVTRFESIAPKGEFTLVLGSKSSSGSAMLEAGDAEIREMVAGLMRDGMSASSAAKTAAKSACAHGGGWGGRRGSGRARFGRAGCGARPRGAPRAITPASRGLLRRTVGHKCREAERCVRHGAPPHGNCPPGHHPGRSYASCPRGRGGCEERGPLCILAVNFRRASTHRPCGTSGSSRQRAVWGDVCSGSSRGGSSTVRGRGLREIALCLRP